MPILCSNVRLNMISISYVGCFGDGRLCDPCLLILDAVSPSLGDRDGPPRAPVPTPSPAHHGAPRGDTVRHKSLD